MENVSSGIKSESIKSLQSAIKKSEKALAQMNQKGASTTLIERRLKALRIGLNVLVNTWNQNSQNFAQSDLVDASEILGGLIPSIEAIYSKLPAGSPQRTLSERRIKALELAVEAIGDLKNRNI